MLAVKLLPYLGVLEPRLQALDMRPQVNQLRLPAPYLQLLPQPLTALLLPAAQLLQVLLVPPLRLLPQLARAARNDARLLEERALERDNLVPLAAARPQRQVARVLVRLAHQTVAHREHERLGENCIF